MILSRNAIEFSALQNIRVFIGRRRVKVDGNYFQLERLFSVNELRPADYTWRYLLRE